MSNEYGIVEGREWEWADELELLMSKIEESIEQSQSLNYKKSWNALKCWLHDRLEQVDIGKSTCQIGSNDEAHFLKAISRYNEVINRMELIEQSQSSKGDED